MGGEEDHLAPGADLVHLDRVEDTKDSRVDKGVKEEVVLAVAGPGELLGALLLILVLSLP